MAVEKSEIQVFFEKLASATPTPGGGSSAALCGATAAALVSMVANLTVGREKYKENWEIMEEVAKKSEELRFKFVELANCDIKGYGNYMDCLGMCKETEEEKKLRRDAMQEALVYITEIPMNTIETCVEVAKLSFKAAKFGNPNAISDAACGAILAEAVARAATHSVRANLPGIKDKEFVLCTEKKMNEALDEVKRELIKTETLISEFLS